MAAFFNLSKYLKQKRLGLNLTQSGLAEELGNVHVQFISNWERGLCAPPNHCFEKLIQVLNLNRNKLVKVMVEDSKTMISEKVYNKVKPIKRFV